MAHGPWPTLKSHHDNFGIFLAFLVLGHSFVQGNVLPNVECWGSEFNIFRGLWPWHERHQKGQIS